MDGSPHSILRVIIPAAISVGATLVGVVLEIIFRWEMPRSFTRYGRATRLTREPDLRDWVQFVGIVACLAALIGFGLWWIWPWLTGLF